VVSAHPGWSGNWAGSASCVAVNDLLAGVPHPATAQPGRGSVFVVAKSAGGVNFKPIWKLSRQGLSVLPRLSVQ
jgi:hypothetical protein